MQNWDSGQTQKPSSIGRCSDPKSEFSGTKCPRYAFWVLAYTVDSLGIVDTRLDDEHGWMHLLILTHQYVAAIVAGGLGLLWHVCDLFYGL